MNLKYFLMILILAKVIFADCNGYQDQFDVRVLDAKLRAVEGASTWITFDRGTSFGTQYYTTPPKTTNSNGVVNYPISTGNTSVRQTDCRIQVNAKIGNIVKSTEILANQHPNIIDLVFSDVYPVQFFVRDSSGASLDGAIVTLDNSTKKIGPTGFVNYFLLKGEYPYFVSYMDGKRSGTLKVADDTAFEVVFTSASLTISILDDTGKPINSKVTILNRTIESIDGVVNIEKTLLTQELDYKVEYLGLIVSGTLDPINNPSAKIILDVHPPVFGQISPQNYSNKIKLIIPIKDEGTFASGVNKTTLKVSYKLEPSDSLTPWSSIAAVAEGRDQYSVIFPQLASDQIVQFKVEVKDEAGNRANIDGRFSTASFSNDKPTDTQNQPPKDEGFPYIYIIIGIVILLIGGFYVYKIRGQSG